MDPFAERMGQEEPVLAVTVTRAMESGQETDDLVAEADAVEFRGDHFPPGAVVDRLHEVSGIIGTLPLILTVRCQEEGGASQLSGDQRLTIIQNSLRFVNAVDIELDASIRNEVIAEVNDREKIVIVSHHNFALTPFNYELEMILDHAKKTGADYIKIAAMIRAPIDVQRLVAFTEKYKKEGIIVVGMSKVGDISPRLAMAKAGSAIVFASATNDPAAPGQIHYQQMADCLQARGIRQRRSTRR
jgi:3-dehydroquinate dehydratase-1